MLNTEYQIWQFTLSPSWDHQSDEPNALYSVINVILSKTSNLHYRVLSIKSSNNDMQSCHVANNMIALRLVIGLLGYSSFRFEWLWEWFREEIAPVSKRCLRWHPSFAQQNECIPAQTKTAVPQLWLTVTSRKVEIEVVHKNHNLCVISKGITLHCIIEWHS